MLIIIVTASPPIVNIAVIIIVIIAPAIFDIVFTIPSIMCDDPTGIVYAVKGVKHFCDSRRPLACVLQSKMNFGA